ncbi:MAG: hypothetical protein AAFR77_06860 [Cyanobacteria bacterium J06631_2]
MTYCILFLLGLLTLWAGFKTADEVYRLALILTAVFPLGWAYLSSPSLLQCSSGIVILCAYQKYISLS